MPGIGNIRQEKILLPGGFCRDFIVVDKYLFDIYLEIPRNFKGQIKGWDIFFLFYRENGLPVYPDSMG